MPRQMSLCFHESIRETTLVRCRTCDDLAILRRVHVGVNSLNFGAPPHSSQPTLIWMLGLKDAAAVADPGGFTPIRMQTPGTGQMAVFGDDARRGTQVFFSSRKYIRVLFIT